MDHHNQEDLWDALFSDDDSLMGSPERATALKQRKAKEAKINNSFSGPYPIDPTDFNHNDKGPNA